MLNEKSELKKLFGKQNGAGKLPVSIKTRIGYNKNSLNEWLPALLETEPAAVLFTPARKEMSLVPAKWDVIADAVRMRDQHDSSKIKL